MLLEGKTGGFMIITTLKPKSKILAWAGLIFGCLLILAVPLAHAQQSSNSIAQGFQADSGNGGIVAGALVSFRASDSSKVALATTTSADYLAGIVDINPLVTISGENQEIDVVLSGTTNALVSDINGPIRAGDKITASPIAGVGMLATADSQIVGTAQAGLKNGEIQNITDRSGNQHRVRIGNVPVQVGVAYYQAPGSNFLPPFIQSVANSIAGRQVSLIRVLLSTVLLLLSFTIVAVLIYTSVRSAMTSLGRNPLAAKAIRKGLYQAAIVALVVVGGSLLASYLILNV
jgi:hypothetical protein